MPRTEITISYRLPSKNKSSIHEKLFGRKQTKRKGILSKYVVIRSHGEISILKRNLPHVARIFRANKVVFTIGPRPVKRASRQRWRRRHGGGDTYYLKPSKDEWYIGYCVGKARSSILRKISKWRTYKYESSETVSRTIQSLITDGKVDSYELRYEIAKIAKEVQDEMQAERFDTLSRTLNLDTRWASIRMHERLANLRGADRRK